MRGFGDEGGDGVGGVDRLLGLFEAGWRRQGFGNSDDELQYRDRAVAALARYYERHNAGAARPVWLERGFSFKIGEHSIRGRIDRVDRHPDGKLELIDYKTGAPKKAEDMGDDVQIALYRIGVREAWDVEAADGSYWYVLDDEKVAVAGEADDLERVERTVLEVAAGINDQDFEPKPELRELHLVRLPADLPGERGVAGRRAFSGPRLSSGAVRGAGTGSAPDLTRGDSGPSRLRRLGAQRGMLDAGSSARDPRSLPAAPEAVNPPPAGHRPPAVTLRPLLRLAPGSPGSPWRSCRHRERPRAEACEVVLLLTRAARPAP